MKIYLLTSLSSFLLSIVITPIVIRIAHRLHLLDIPNIRSLHSRPVARLGGIAIYTAVLLSILPVLFLDNPIAGQFQQSLPQLLALLIGASLVFGLGLRDDLNYLRIRYKLIGEFIAVLVIIVGGLQITHVTVEGLFSIQLGMLGTVLTVLWIVGITNAVNLIDGMDGLAAGISAIACGIIAFLAIGQGNPVLAVIVLALLGALLGFLLFNFHPAKIFMGDCGSLFLGFTLATAAVMTSAKAETLVGFGIPIVVLGIPIFDTLFTVVRRFLQRRLIMSPDRAHFHHRLLRRGLTQRQVALVAYSLTLLISGPALLMLLVRSAYGCLLFTACLTLYLLVFHYVGAIRLKETIHAIRRRNRLAHRQRLDRKHFEEAHLHFDRVQSFQQWWECICLAADKLDFHRITLQSPQRDGKDLTLVWKKARNGKPEPESNELLRLILPVKDRRKHQSLKIEMNVVTNGSIESAGYRVSLFTRLTEEHSLATLLGKSSTLQTLSDSWQVKHLAKFQSDTKRQARNGRQKAEPAGGIPKEFSV